MEKVIAAVDMVKVAGNKALSAKRIYVNLGLEIRTLKQEIRDAQRADNRRLVSNLHAALKYRRLELEAATEYYAECRAEFSYMCNMKFDLEQKAKAA